MAKAANGQPTRFITLTVNPRRPGTPEDRLRELAHAWRVIILRLRRLHPTEPSQYLAIVEATEAGEPHLHILFRGPYIPQGWLSDAMRELIDAPIVDIRKVKSVAHAVRYVAKYVTKRPAQFGTSKRYWSSQAYAIADPEYVKPEKGCEAAWRLVFERMDTLCKAWTMLGYPGRQHENGGYVFFKPKALQTGPPPTEIKPRPPMKGWF